MASGLYIKVFSYFSPLRGVRDADELALPLGASKTSPISSVDVARAVAAILDDPAPHIGHIYNLTGPESVDLDHYAARKMKIHAPKVTCRPSKSVCALVESSYGRSLGFRGRPGV
jgi:hypothetical protein